MRAVAAGLVAIAAFFISLIGGGGGSGKAPRDPAAVAHGARATVGQLAADLNRAQATIDGPSSSAVELAQAGRLEQLDALELERERRRARRAVLAGLDGPARASTRADLAAAAALGRLVVAHRSLPPWRIVTPPSPHRLLSYFRAAQGRFGVPWEFLAAIEFVETKFGRVVGPSDAGAQGPMQFLPATWAEYGRGNIHDPRAAIPAAARYLVTSGARRNMAGALYRYNPSLDYVHAVEDYAHVMRTDPRAFYGYYYWQVTFDLRGRRVILPPGYPKVRPPPLGY